MFGIKQKIRAWKNKRLAHKLRNLMKTLDRTLKASNFNRKQRKLFWKEFAKDEEVRWNAINKFIEQLT